MQAAPPTQTTSPRCSGAASCPPVKVYTPESLEAGLEAAARAFCESGLWVCGAGPGAGGSCWLGPEAVPLLLRLHVVIPFLKALLWHSCAPAVVGEVQVDEAARELSLSSILKWCAATSCCSRCRCCCRCCCHCCSVRLLSACRLHKPNDFHACSMLFNAGMGGTLAARNSCWSSLQHMSARPKRRRCVG